MTKGCRKRSAQAVPDYLVKQGVSGLSIKSKGFGESNPIAPNETAEGRQKNRRVEMIVSGDTIEPVK